MVPPLGTKPSFPALPTRVIPKLKGLSSIDSFAFGQQQLKPAIADLLKKQAIEAGDILLDNPAKVRLLGMMPSFKGLADQGKTATEIFNNLELSIFLSKAENGTATLYILGDKYNTNNITLESETNLTRALQLMEGNGSDQWAGIAGLAGIPIPAGHPKLPEICSCLAQIINRAPSNDLPATISKAAAEMALAIKELLSDNEKTVIRNSARNMAGFYVSLSNDYTRANMFDRATENQSIAALLDKIIIDFSPPVEAAKGFDRSVLEKTFLLTTFNDKEWKNETVTATVSQVIVPIEFEKLFSPGYSNQRLMTIYEALYKLADTIGYIPPRSGLDHIFAEMGAIFRKRDPSLIPAGMDSAKYYLSQEQNFKRWTGAAILSNIPAASDSREAAEIIRMIEAFGQTEKYRFVIDELISAAAKIRGESKPGTEINDQALRVINIMRARIDRGELL